MATEQVPLSSLSAEQLLDLRQSLEQEVQTMAQSGLTLQSTAAKFGAAGQAVEYLQDQKQGMSSLWTCTAGACGRLRAGRQCCSERGCRCAVAAPPTALRRSPLAHPQASPCCCR